MLNSAIANKDNKSVELQRTIGIMEEKLNKQDLYFQALYCKLAIILKNTILVQEAPQLREKGGKIEK